MSRTPFEIRPIESDIRIRPLSEKMKIKPVKKKKKQDKLAKSRYNRDIRTRDKNTPDGGR